MPFLEKGWKVVLKQRNNRTLRPNCDIANADWFTAEKYPSILYLADFSLEPEAAWILFH